MVRAGADRIVSLTGEVRPVPDLQVARPDCVSPSPAPRKLPIVWDNDARAQFILKAFSSPSPLAAMITELESVVPGAAEILGEIRKSRIQRKSVSPAPPISPEQGAKAVDTLEQLLARVRILTKVWNN